MMAKKSFTIVPGSAIEEFRGQWAAFDGFANFPKFLSREFDVPRGKWRITKTQGDGNGMQISAGEIVFWGDDSLAYATTLQLLRQGHDELPLAKIEESPAFGMRVFHLDIARGGVPNLATIKRILRWLFILKYTHFALYLEDLFPWRKYPKIGIRRGRLSEEELRQAVDYGRQLGMEVFPSLELAGHMENILSLRNFWGYGEWHRFSEGCLDLSNEAAKGLAYDLLSEVLDFFPSRHIHIGGDETWALGRGKSLDRKGSFEGPQLYESHHRRMIEMVRNKGKEPILWADIISGSILMGDTVTEEAKKKWSRLIDSVLWREVLLANWDYNPVEPPAYFREKIKQFNDRSLNQLACPSLRNENKYYPNFQRAESNLQNFLAAARQERLPGFMVTAWGDMGGECLFSFLDPLLIAAVEFSEGKGDWQKPWCALSGEDQKTVRARRLFGFPAVAQHMKSALFRSVHFENLDARRRKAIYEDWNRVLEETRATVLPEDLAFVRSMLEVTVRVYEEKGEVSDYLGLCQRYARLWKAERKIPGLDTVVRRFWAAAGAQDMRLFADSRGFLSS
jgi:hypothetical protein